jgi:alginate O-acetyltransferase complex protein AlgI
LLADPLGRRASLVFETAQSGPVAMADAWYGVITFQLQLFFDFSAYAEMSIGLAMMLGMTMPLNFDRPLFARDRADLWRRWHISFSTFMRNTVFMPLMRRWKWPAWAALALTGVLSGLWHGLGATFVLWGLLQTAILLWLHWRTTSRRHSGKAPLPAAIAIPVTFATTCLIGALFRSPDIAAAQSIYASLLGLGSLQDGIVSHLSAKGLAMTLTGALVVWGLPDLGQLFRGQWRYTELRAGAQPPPRHWLEPWLAFRPGGAWGCACAIALVVALFMLVRQEQAARFIYVQF